MSQRILEMAKTGVYRSSIFEAFQPVATKRHISLAIRHAKKFGLHSVAKLRHGELGTYYQVDLATYQACQTALQKSIPMESEEDVVKRMMDAVMMIQMMLTIAAGGAIAFFGMGLVCFTTGKPNLGWGLLTSSVGAVGIWTLQKAIAKKVI
jgi:hypothetical protein